ncbi:hypothetical protein LZ575_09425 [Antarcticibacterium sp. 1MA-6-2]|uniref:hypothetical protein n=1 Tax=Antarcticibacterium sp. 1MA-6-2 TaxID=2908210 RepID=UPI001F3C992D|nr:hypothetical protein [Antarcticibacterium sp. 1MA-6-2]UJH92660.1 hypothetical protein LZ575_09425 [Antarcticibacterium sp. 1MA-6-2]
MNKKNFLTVMLLLFSYTTFACDCECEGDCSFINIAHTVDFVALVKVAEYSDYLEEEILGYDGSMPLSMTVEIIKKYKGEETRSQIKIWGDNGALCRPYTANFEVGKYYLIAPEKVKEQQENENLSDYEFFSCWTDYLEVDNDLQKVYGHYSKNRDKVTLQRFEKDVRK